MGRFLWAVQTYKTLTVGQLMLRLIVPHVLLLLGLGLIVAAVISFTRAAIIRKRMQNEPL